MGQIRNKKIDLYIVCTRQRSSRLRSRKTETELLGFLIAQKRKHSMYLDVVCAKRGYGSRLIERFEEYAVQNGYTVTELKAIASAEEFWKKKGYRNLPPTKACSKAREKKVSYGLHGSRMAKCHKTTEE